MRLFTPGEPVSFQLVRDRFREDPLDDDRWRDMAQGLNQKIATSTPVYGERRGDYIWTAAENDTDAELPVLLLDYWRYAPVRRRA